MVPDPGCEDPFGFAFALCLTALPLACLWLSRAGLTLGTGYALICAFFWGGSTVAGRGVMMGMSLRLASSMRVVVGLFKSVAVFTSGLSSVGDMAKDWMNLPLIVESLLGTLLWGLFIVAFSRKVIR